MALAKNATTETEKEEDNQSHEYICTKTIV
jgi:hypothetical protein